MAVEIERKFLVVADGWKTLVESSDHYGQGYLATAENCLVRVRVGNTQAWLTLKGRDQHDPNMPGEILKRVEYEYPIPKADGQQMLAEMSYASLEKTRHYLKTSEHVWTVDVFLGALTGLVLLEIEGDNVETLTAADLPAWVGKEVTHDPQYANANLALKQATA
ncbi:CYTH domain-containing protein [Gleimia sp. 6138-11-ORH1]|uniref:CYTH domain-containing protein n=1 Tax=Gleimia sp. 6138-11-ORH1 TaxID=2973937 RepID=UPI0021688F73|nr:CYTH domain-containing protein [Gleimia sp. 6138-11-ORH1]MCS4484275.1 CYTH domain-containing protein [Gleimia sp. 6138-11-ORH1]